MTEHRLLDLLTKHNLTIATAESCTGGLVAGFLCDISGISEFFEEGYITYSEKAKTKNLDVSPELITTFGVVSEETALAMAKGAAKRADAVCAVSTTGVAGPTGGNEEIPVGTVCFGCVVDGHEFTETVHFEGSRMEVRVQAAQFALMYLMNNISDIFE